jgi:hypothetical protein
MPSAIAHINKYSKKCDKAQDGIAPHIKQSADIETTQNPAMSPGHSHPNTPLIYGALSRPNGTQIFQALLLSHSKTQPPTIVVAIDLHDWKRLRYDIITRQGVTHVHVNFS